jgi:hypothetical protein
LPHDGVQVPLSTEMKWSAAQAMQVIAFVAHLLQFGEQL